MTLTITANDQTQTYGFGSLGATGYSISGVTLATNDGASTSGNYKATSSPATITPSAAVFSSGSASNYAIVYDNAPTGLTVNKAPLTITGFAVDNKNYDGTTTATISSRKAFSRPADAPTTPGLKTRQQSPPSRRPYGTGACRLLTWP